MAEASETTVIGADSHFKGELTFESTAKIIGRFDGKISGNGNLQVAPNAACKADVSSGGVEVDGTVEGNINVKDMVKLNSKGTVKGDITAAKMIMAEGASFYGMCAVGPDAKGRASGGGGGGGAPSHAGPHDLGKDKDQPKK